MVVRKINTPLTWVPQKKFTTPFQIPKPRKAAESLNRSCSSGSSAAPTLVLDSLPFGTEGMDTLEPLPEEMAMKAAEFAEHEPHVEIPAAPQVS